MPLPAAIDGALTPEAAVLFVEVLDQRPVRLRAERGRGIVLLDAGNRVCGGPYRPPAAVARDVVARGGCVVFEVDGGGPARVSRVALDRGGAR